MLEIIYFHNAQKSLEIIIENIIEHPEIIQICIECNRKDLFDYLCESFLFKQFDENRLNIDYFEEVEEVEETETPVIVTSVEINDDIENDINYIQTISNNTIIDESVYDWVTGNIKKLLEQVAEDE